MKECLSVAHAAAPAAGGAVVNSLFADDAVADEAVVEEGVAAEAIAQ